MHIVIHLTKQFGSTTLNTGNLESIDFRWYIVSITSVEGLVRFYASLL
jgi:hypothetical protein